MISEKTLTLRWNQLALDAIKFTRTSAPLAARAMAMLYTAMYDTWSVYNKSAISTTTALYIKQPKENCSKENSRKAFSFAAYRILTELFWLRLPPEHKDMFNVLMCELGYHADNTTFNLMLPEGIGNMAARMTIEYRNGDGSNAHGTLHSPPWSDYTGYVPVNTPDQVNDLDKWQPQRTEVSPGIEKTRHFMLPQWGLLRSFSLNPNSQFRPDGPFGKSQDEFKEQTKEIIEASAALNDEQKCIAEYWAGGHGTYTTPGRWFEIAQHIAENECYKNSQCIKLFFALSNALLDTSIAVWECKHYYDAVCPITAVREIYWGLDIQAWAGPGQGTKTIRGENWRPYIPTPSYPEYVCDQSAYGSAAALILKHFKGDDEFSGCHRFEKGNSVIEPGITPSKDIVVEWTSFSDAAKQSGNSCLYAGTNFKHGIEKGHEVGNAVGLSAWEKAKFYFNEQNAYQTKSELIYTIKN
jgi:hypothetical protein